MDWLNRLWQEVGFIGHLKTKKMALPLRLIKSG
jgi:hypothetical protein